MIINFDKKYIALAIIAVLFLAGGVFAQTGPGQELIGSQQIEVTGFDNSLLAATDFDKYDMEFKIENIEEDTDFYYVQYTYNDFYKSVDSWQKQINEKTIKISKKSNAKLDKYIARELTQTKEDRVRELKQIKNKINGNEKRVQVVKYSGLIGKTLDITSGLFPGFEPEERIDMPLLANQNNTSVPGISPQSVENLEDVYNYFLISHPELDITTSSTIENVEATTSEPNIEIATSSLPIISSSSEVIQ